MNLTSKVQLRTGRSMPVIGLGTWQLTENTADTVAAALRLGYPMIDTSSDYGTQPGIGAGIKQSGVARSDFYLVTKVEEDDDALDKLSKKYSKTEGQLLIMPKSFGFSLMTARSWLSASTKTSISELSSLKFCDSNFSISGPSVLAVTFDCSRTLPLLM